MTRVVDRIATAASISVSGASLAVFRIGFGLVAAFVAVRWLAYGWVDALLVDPPIHFTYPGFGWVAPLPGVGMHLVVGTMVAAGLAIALGYRFRAAAALVSAGMAYVQLIDQTLYINHYYWMVLTAAVLACSPAHRMWSLDARRRTAPGDGTVPARWVWLLRFQVGMVYVFAGLAKVSADWLLHAQPLATWLPARADLPLVGPLLALPGTAHALSWAGALFDLTIVAWLLWPRTRPVAIAAVVVFHVATWLLFPAIGVFPWPMIVGATMFLAPDWPQRLGMWSPTPRTGRAAVASVARRPGRAVVVVVAVYVVVMVALPFRHVAGGDDLLWAGSGYRFGWRVMLVEKTGTVDFVVTDPVAGTTWVEPAPPELTPRQVAVMAIDPALIRRTAEIVATRHRTHAGHDVEVRAESHVSFNGRRHARLIDPTVDLTAVSALGAWVLPPPRDRSTLRESSAAAGLGR